MRINIKKYILFQLGIMIILLSAMFSFSNQFINVMISLGVMALCVINLLYSRCNMIGFLLHIQLFYYNYSVVFSRYIYTVNEFQEFYTNVNDKVYGIGIVALFIFELSMALVAKKNKKEFEWNLLYARNENLLISGMLLLICVIIGIVGFERSIYGSRGAASVYYEYSGILFILGLYYAGTKKNFLIKIGYSICMLAFIIQGLVFGERVAPLQFMIIWVVFFVNQKLKNRDILILCFLGIVLMTFVGGYRSSYNLDGLTLSNILDTMFRRLLTFNGADLGYYSSLTFVMVAEKVGWGERLQMLWKFLISVVLGNSNELSLTHFTRQYYYHWNGGFYPLYFYFYGGILGIVVACWVWCKCVCVWIFNEGEKNKAFWRLLGVYIMSVSSRWYMYTPLSAFRCTLLFAVAYISMECFNRIMSK